MSGDLGRSHEVVCLALWSGTGLVMLSDVAARKSATVQFVRKEAFVASKRMIGAFLKSGMSLDQSLSRTFEIADEMDQVVLKMQFSSPSYSPRRFVTTPTV